jgi:hypothetical protein
MRTTPSMPAANSGRRVVELAFLSADGHPILVAVDSSNRERARMVLSDPGALEATTSALWDALDAVDPSAPCFTGGPALLEEYAARQRRATMLIEERAAILRAEAMRANDQCMDTLSSLLHEPQRRGAIHRGVGRTSRAVAYRTGDPRVIRLVPPERC